MTDDTEIIHYIIYSKCSLSQMCKHMTEFQNKLFVWTVLCLHQEQQIEYRLYGCSQEILIISDQDGGSVMFYMNI